MKVISPTHISPWERSSSQNQILEEMTRLQNEISKKRAERDFDSVEELEREIDQLQKRFLVKD